MNIYALIAKRVCGENYGLNAVFFALKIVTNRTKLHEINHAIFNNIFVTDNEQATLFSLFTKIQHTYWAFNKLAKIYRWKKARLSSVDIDLYLNPLSSFKPNHKIRFLQNNTIHEFRLTDILKLCMKSITASANIRPRPTFPKNPFNNIEFTKTDMINIYIALKNTNFTIPPLLEKLYKVEFDLFKFYKECYPELMEYSIENYVANSNNETLFYDIVNMVSQYTRHRINPNISNLYRTRIVKLLKKTFHNHLIATMSHNPIKQRGCKRKVIRKLRKLFEKYPYFGRRFVRHQRQNNRTYSTNNHTHQRQSIEFTLTSSEEDSDNEHNEHDNDNGIIWFEGFGDNFNNQDVEEFEFTINYERNEINNQNEYEADDNDETYNTDTEDAYPNDISQGTAIMRSHVDYIGNEYYEFNIYP